MRTTDARPRRASRLLRIIAAAAIVLSTSTAIVAMEPAPPAQAATYGYGYNGGTPCTGCGAGWMGSVFMPDGTQGFCIDPIGLFPSGASSNQGLISFIQGTTSATWPGHNDTRSVSGVAIQQLNYALTKYTPLIDTNNEGAALAAYVYMHTVAGNLASYGINSWDDYVDVRVPASQRATVKAMANAIAADAGANYATGGSGTANVDINMLDSYSGTVTTAITPTNLTGTLTLIGAHFTDTGLSTRTVSSGQVLAIEGDPLDSDIHDYSIEAILQVSIPGAVSSSLTLWRTASPAYAQRDISIGAPGPPTTITATDFVDDPELPFAPVLTTAVQSQFVNIGDAYVDTVIAGVADDSPAWRQFTDGTYVPIIARGTLYGPFSDAPVESADVPVDAPVIGTETMTLTGPGTHVGPSTIIATEAGYATWVWEIRAEDQPLIFRDRLVEDYVFTDLFGRAAETHVVASSIEATTEANAEQVAVTEGIWDTLTVTAPTDPWLTIGGVYVPVTFTGVAYWEAGDTPPVGAAGPPATATVLDYRTIVANGPGTYSTIDEPIEAPSGNGYVVWQWSIVQANQPPEYQGYFEDWTDAYGLTAETTRVELPTVTTQATAEVALTDDAYDVAVVDGLVPAGSYLTFTAFRQPLAGEPTNEVTIQRVINEDGIPVWEESDLFDVDGNAIPICEPGNIVFESYDNPTPINDGLNSFQSYQSPSFEPEETGTYYWIEHLHRADGRELSRGLCGAEGETTIVSLPTVTTTADSSALMGTMASDNAHVDGLVPEGATLTFAAYLHTDDVAEGDRGALICDTSDRPLDVRPGLHVDETYRSPSCRMPSTVGEVFWVETLLSDQGDVLHEGEYGVVAEITRVIPPLPHAGGGEDAEAAVPWALGAVGLGSAIVTLLWLRRRRIILRG